MEDYIADQKYGAAGYNFNNNADNALRPIGAAIVFNEMGGDDGTKWDYTLRFNSSNVPATDTTIDIFTRNVDQLFYNSIYTYAGYSGFIQLQSWLDQGIMQHIIFNVWNTDDSNDIEVDYDQFIEQTEMYSKGIFMFPTAAYNQDDYWNFFGAAFPFFLFIMFCYPIITVLSILVEEKQSKIKEGMFSIYMNWELSIAKNQYFVNYKE